MDLATAQAKLAAVQSAYDKALTGMTVYYGDMRITRQNIDVLRTEMAYWQRTVLALTAQAQGASGDLSVRTPKWT
jgi:hypothetical protein